MKPMNFLLLIALSCLLTACPKKKTGDESAAESSAYSPPSEGEEEEEFAENESEELGEGDQETSM